MSKQGTWRAEAFASSLTGVSQHTRDAYTHDVDEFVAWCARGDLAPADIDRRALRRYLAYLDTRGFARPSIARKAAAIRSYLRYLRRHGVIDHDPGASLRAPKGASRLPRVPHVDDANALLDAAAEPRSHGRRDRSGRPSRDAARPRAARGALRSRAPHRGVLRSPSRRLRSAARARHRARQGIEGASGADRRTRGRLRSSRGSTTVGMRL